MSYWRTYAHVVWAVSGRRRLLTGDRARIAEAAIRNKAHDLRCLVHGVAVQPDHVHLVLSFSPSRVPTSVIGQIKGASSFLLRQRDPDLVDEGFRWQHEYGVISIGPDELGRVLAYLANQERHHAEGRLLDQMERDTEPPLG